MFAGEVDLNTWYKPAIDKKILKEWYLSRLKTIKLKRDTVTVGHKDILVLT